MSKSNRRYIIAIGGLAVLAAIIGIGYLTAPEKISLRHGVEESERQSSNHNQVTCNADCQVSFGLSKGENVAKEGHSGPEGNAYSAAQIAVMDLNAQRSMAHWATVLAWLTFAGAAILIATLVETANATDAAANAANITREIGQTQTRAYLGGVRAWVVEHGQKGFYCYFEVKNFGQSPAEKIEVKMRAQYNITAKGADSCTEKRPYWQTQCNHPRSLAPGAKGRCAIFIERSFVDAILLDSPKEIRFYFMADLWWFDVYGAEAEREAEELYTHMTASQKLGSWDRNQPIGEMEIQGSDPSGGYSIRH